MLSKLNIGADPSVKEDVKHREALRHWKVAGMVSPNNERDCTAVEQ